MSVDPLPAGALTTWLRAAVPAIPVADEPVVVERIAGGHSNLTYRVVDATGRPWALRRPPVGVAPSTAHDMSREWRFLVALAPTAVPVPHPVAYCADRGVAGAEFYLMRFVDGAVLDEPAAGLLLAPPARRRAALALIDVLAELHAVDPGVVGRGGLRRECDYVARQLRRWHRQAHASAVPDLSAVDRAHARLVQWARTLPATGARIVHGDFRFGNVAVAADGAVRAVFDWELATLGDPLADLGWFVASWGRGTDPVEPIVPGPGPDQGFPDGDELVRRYAERTGRDVAGLDGYVAFARWRMACIRAGVYTRYATGGMGESHRDVADIHLDAVTVQAEAALTALEG